MQPPRTIIQKRINEKIVNIIKNEGVGILLTDTLYGIVGSALSKRVVSRIYKVRNRNLRKPMIVLIGSIDDLKKFGIVLSPQTKRQINNIWPAKVSIIFPCSRKKFFYLHRGTKNIAFRLPTPIGLRNVLKKTGPLVAPSANPEGEPPAQTIQKARAYFENKIDFYIDAGRIISKPSMLIRLQKNGSYEILRK